MSATFTEVLPATKSSPHAAVRWTPGRTPGTGLVAVHNRRAVTEYHVRELPTDWIGRGFRFRKPDGHPGTDAEADAYDVFCGPTDRDHRCDCKGFLRWNRPCKHILAALALIDNDWI